MAMLPRLSQRRDKTWAPPRPTPTWVALTLIVVLTIALPALSLCLLAPVVPRLMYWTQFAIALVYTGTSAMILYEGLLALPRPRSGNGTIPDAEDLPMCTAIVAAYLPNEQDIIVETLLHLLSEVDVPDDKYQVIVAYNTPHPLPVEEDLRRMAEADPRLVVLPVPGSRSKAQNVNAAIEVATGEIVAVYDADHWPNADCFRRAWSSLNNGVDMVQGRCVIRNEGTSWLTRLIAVEFDVMYACSHQGRARLSGSGIFGGSNAYWRAEALRAIQLDDTMLTEDIDASVRALLAGQRMAHDRNIVSRELAPLRVAHWYTQRKRWSQGWFEVSLKHGCAVIKSRRLTLREKVLWWYLLSWREFFPLLSLQFFSLMTASLLLHYRVDWFAHGYFLATSIVNLTSGAILVAITRACSLPDTRKGHGQAYIAYALIGIAYTTVKTFVMLLAQYSQLSREHNWVATPRATAGATAIVVDVSSPALHTARPIEPSITSCAKTPTDTAV